jgi:hypothetical protein
VTNPIIGGDEIATLVRNLRILNTAGQLSFLGAGGGASAFTDLTDSATVDLAAINSPLALDLAALMPFSALVNDLTTGGTNVPLAAQQAVVLKALIDGTLLQGTGAPVAGLGVVGQSYLRMDAPFDGILYKKTGPTTWAAQTTSKATLAALYTSYPPSATYSGCVVWVDAYDCDFLCKSYDGGTTYVWVPLSRRLTLVDVPTTGTARAGNTTTPVIDSTHVIPGKLLITGVEMHVEAAATYATTNADTARTAFFRHQGTGILLLDMSTTLATHVSSFGHNFLIIRNGTANAYQPVGNRSNNSGYYQNQTTNFFTANGVTFDPTADSTWEFGVVNTPTTSTVTFEYKRLELLYPQ